MIPQRVLIIGGGIGGMTLAAALHRVGIRADVFEQAPAIGEVGAGIALWPNARASLAQIGAADDAVRSCTPLRRSEGLNHHGRYLSAIDLAADLPEAPGAHFHIVHRAALLAAITAQVPPDQIHTGHRCTALAETPTGVHANFAPAAPTASADAAPSASIPTAEGDILVGADGIRSAVRPHIVQDAVRYSGQTCCRGVTTFALEAPDVLREIQGPGQRCGIAPIGGGRVYWWTAHNAPAGQPMPAGQRQQELLRRFRGWPGQIEDLLAATPEEHILHNDLCDRTPVTGWSRGRVTLLGDAAHPTTPNLGQGANMAIDDGLVLARALREAPDAAAAFAQYERERLPRTTQIVRRSWQFGSLCRWQSAPGVALREALVRATPRALLRAELRTLVMERIPPLVR